MPPGSRQAIPMIAIGPEASDHRGVKQWPEQIHSPSQHCGLAVSATGRYVDIRGE